MKIEVILTESEIAQEFSEAMQARDLPEKFFYWLPPSVTAWLALLQDPVLEGLSQGWKMLALKSGSLTRHFGKAVPVISVGAGNGAQDRPLLEALKGRELRYFPVDASQSLLEMACAAAEDADIETVGIKADISNPIHLVFASDAAESPKLFLMAGNTLGAFDPLDQVRQLSQALRPGDRLILDGEMYDENTLARRESDAVRRFAFAPLASMGITPDDGELQFELKQDQEHPGLYLVTRHFRAARDLHATVSGEEILIERGERLAMNFQYTYTPEAFVWLLEEHAGLNILDEITAPDGKYRLAVCAR